MKSVQTGSFRPDIRKVVGEVWILEMIPNKLTLDIIYDPYQ